MQVYPFSKWLSLISVKTKNCRYSNNLKLIILTKHQTSISSIFGMNDISGIKMALMFYSKYKLL